MCSMFVIFKHTLIYMYTYDTSSIYTNQFLFPLHMYNERICFTNNHNGRNYGGDGEIAIVDDDGNTIEIINEDEQRRIRW